MAQNTENPRASEARPTQQYATNMQGESPPTEDGYFRQVGRLTRQAIAKNPKADRAYRTTVGVVGGGATALGVVMMPLPGPGALVAIGGLSILATEFKTPAKVRDVSIKGLKAATAKAKELNEKRMAASTDPDN